MRAAALLCALAFGGCGKHHDRQPATEAAPAYSIQLRVDRQLVRTITAADVGTGVSLRSLLPAEARDPSSWYSLHARAGGRQLSLDDYADKFAELDARVEPGPRLALYRRPPPGAPAHVVEALKTPRQELAGIELIKIATHPPAQAQAQAWTFELVAGDATRRVSTDDLATLPQSDASMPPGTRGPPGDRQRERRRGWRLADVIALAEPSAPPVRVTVTGDGDTLSLSLAELTDRTVVPLLATNRHGAVGLRVFRAGLEKERVRRVSRIDVELEKP